MQTLISNKNKCVKQNLIRCKTIVGEDKRACIVYMILHALLLQKPSKNSKAKDHCRKLDERITAWKEGRIMDIFQEGRTIQSRMTTSKPRSSEDEALTFAKFINQGKVNAVLKMLSDSEIHEVNKGVLKELKAKHQKPSTITENTLLNGPINHTLPSYFDSINEAMIFKATTLIKGAGYPSQFDANQYRDILPVTNTRKRIK